MIDDLEIVQELMRQRQKVSVNAVWEKNLKMILRDHKKATERKTSIHDLINESMQMSAEMREREMQVT